MVSRTLFLEEHMANRLRGKVDDVGGKMDSFNSQVSKMDKCRRLATAGRTL
jgi:hypothetical protein